MPSTPYPWIPPPVPAAACLSTSAWAATVGLTCQNTNSGARVVDAINTKGTVACPPGCLGARGSVWGTGAFTADSSICRWVPSATPAAEAA